MSRRAIPTMADAEARARLAIDARRRRESAEHARADAERARAAMAALPSIRLARRAAVARAAHLADARRAWLTPVHEQLIAEARSDMLAAVPDSVESFDWS